MKFYTYIYLDPRKPGNYQYGDYTFDFEPFYVGKGYKQQYKVHLLEARKGKFVSFNRHKFNKIKVILKNNLEPIILKVEENLSEQEAFELEIWLICTIGRSDLELGPLTNLTDGGEGFINPSIEYRDSAKERALNQWSNKESRQKLIDSKQNSWSESSKQKQANFVKNRFKNPEERRKQSEKIKETFINDPTLRSNHIKRIKGNSYHSKPWKVTFPDGHSEIINNLASLCRKLNLNISSSIRLGYRVERIK